MQVHPHIAAAGAVTAIHTVFSLFNNELFFKSVNARPNRLAVGVYSATSMASFLLAITILCKLGAVPTQAKHLGHWCFCVASTGMSLHVGHVVGKATSDTVTKYPLTSDRLSSLFRATVHDAAKVTSGMLLGILIATHREALDNYLHA